MVTNLCYADDIILFANLEAELQELVDHCRDAFPIEGVLVATYLLSVEALPHCR